jgi:hypothetical protein
MLRRMDGVISSADGTKLAVRRIGRGRPVVTLHGSGGGLRSWAAVAEPLTGVRAQPPGHPLVPVLARYRALLADGEITVARSMQGALTWEPMPTTMAALPSVLPRVERACWDGQSHFATSTAPGLVAHTLRGFLLQHQPMQTSN